MPVCVSALIAGIAGSALAAAPAPAPAPATDSGASSLTKPFPPAVFRDFDPFTMRDPFCPVGYMKPLPPTPGKDPVKPPPNPPVFEIDFIIGKTATIKGGAMFGEGETFPHIKTGDTYTVNAVTYTYKGKPLTFKILKITEDSVIILYDGKEHTYKLPNSDMNLFQEKESEKKE